MTGGRWRALVSLLRLLTLLGLDDGLVGLRREGGHYCLGNEGTQQLLALEKLLVFATETLGLHPNISMHGLESEDLLLELTDALFLAGTELLSSRTRLGYS